MRDSGFSQSSLAASMERVFRPMSTGQRAARRRRRFRLGMPRIYCSAALKWSSALRMPHSQNRASTVGVDGVKQVLGAQPYPVEFVLRQVTATDAKVFGDIAQDVGHLKRLAEAHTERLHFWLFPIHERRRVCDRYGCPELTHATRYKVAVYVQLLGSFSAVSLPEFSA